MAITNATVIPKVIAAQMLLAFRDATVFTSRVNNTWRSQLNNGGNTVIINRPGPASIQDYTIDGTITYTNADVGAPIELSLSKQKSWSIKFDDINAALSVLDVLQSAVVEHGVKLAETVDTDVRAAMVADATGGPAIALDHDDAELGVEDLLTPQLNRIMDVNKLPRQGRWAIIAPYTAEVVQKISMSNDHILASPTRTNLVNGNLGSFGGITFYVAPDTWSGFNSGQKKATETIVYGVDSATAFIDQVRRTEQLRLQNTFADAVRGLYTYGVKVIDPTRIFKSTATITNIPA